jgi:hypothetical protein
MSTGASTGTSTEVPEVGIVDMKLEVVTLPTVTADHNITGPATGRSCTTSPPGLTAATKASSSGADALDSAAAPGARRPLPLPTNGRRECRSSPERPVKGADCGVSRLTDNARKPAWFQELRGGSRVSTARLEILGVPGSSPGPAIRKLPARRLSDDLGDALATDPAVPRVLDLSAPVREAARARDSRERGILDGLHEAAVAGDRASVFEHELVDRAGDDRLGRDVRRDYHQLLRRPRRGPLRFAPECPGAAVGCRVGCELVLVAAKRAAVGDLHRALEHVAAAVTDVRNQSSSR